jgi:hypothetical protein
MRRVYSSSNSFEAFWVSHTIPHKASSDILVMLGLGLWGWAPRSLDQFAAKKRVFEAKLEELRG